MARRIGPILPVMAAACSLLANVHAHADSESTEDRMRDALRQAVTEMRAAQDQAAQAQADLAKAQADKTALQSQLDAANAKLAETAGKPAAKPADLAALQAQLQQAQSQSAGLQQAYAKLQAGYQGAADQVRAAGEQSRQLEGGLRANTAALQTCKATNGKLIDVAEQILHLYQSQGFRSILLKSYEPVIGFERVKLENLVQDYDDKIHDQEYVAPKTR